MMVRCVVCQFDNPAGSRLCRSCGSSLPASAPPGANVGLAAPSRLPTHGYVLRGPQAAIYPLRGVKAQIGRRPDCDVQVMDTTVSGCHATLTLQGGQWWLEDLGSSNGTRLNGVRIPAHQPFPVPLGSCLELGSWQADLQNLAAPGPGSPPRAVPARGTLAGTARGGWLGRLSFGRRRPGALSPHPVAAGMVTSVLPEVGIDPPQDLSRWLVRVAIFGGLIGSVILPTLAHWLFLVVGLVCLGLLLVMLRFVGTFLMPLGVFAVYGRRNAAPSGLRGFQWSLFDGKTQQSLSGRLIHAPGQSGYVTVGDEVVVYGRTNRYQLVEASHIIVTQRAGSPIRAHIKGLRPWPLSIGLAACLLSAGLLLALAWALHLL